MNTITASLIAASARDGLTVWEYADGSAMVRMGDAPGADMMMISAEQVGAVWRALKAIEERARANV